MAADNEYQSAGWVVESAKGPNQREALLNEESKRAPNIFRPASEFNSLRIANYDGSTTAQGAAPKKLRANRSWVLAKGYGERLDTPNGTKFRCLVPGCGREYACHNSSTSTIIAHLSKVHQITDKSADTSEGRSLQVTHSRRKIKGFREASLYAALEDFFVGNRMSPRVADDPRLRRLLEEAASASQLALSADLVRSSIAASLIQYRALLKQIIRQQATVSLSISRWWCDSGSVFIGVTAHFIDQMWCQRDVLLALFPSTEDLGSKVLQTLSEMDLVDKVFTVTPDPDTEVGGLARALEVARPRLELSQLLVPCLSHILHSAVIGGVMRSAATNPALAKIRAGIAAIQQTPSATTHFRSHAKCALVLDSSFWDSAYFMITSVLDSIEVYNSTCVQFGAETYALDAADLDFICDFKELLLIFHSFAEHLESRYPTINQVELLYDLALQSLAKATTFKTETSREAATSALVILKQYYSREQASSLHTVAMAMDPRVKFSHWRSHTFNPESFDKYKGFVVHFWEKRFRPNDPSTGSFNLDSLFNLEPSTDDLKCYVGEPTHPASTSVLDYWRHASQTFPHLARMAKMFLAIPAVSTPTSSSLRNSLQRVPFTQAHNSMETFEHYILLENWKAAVSTGNN